MMAWSYMPKMQCWQGLQHFVDVASMNYGNENYTPFG